MAWPLVAAAVGGAALNYMGGRAAAKQSEAAAQQQADAMNKAIDALNAVGIPSVEAQQLVLENPELIYKFSPELEQAVQLDKTAMGDIKTDPRLQAAQMSALEGMQQRASGGLTPEDLASLRDIQRGQGQQFASQNASIMQDMAQRGAGGSGAELAAKLAASQGAYQQGAQQSDALAAQNYQAKMQALQAAGQMGGQMQEQEFGQKAKQATAEDAMKQFNAQYQSEAQQRNVAAQNSANEYAARLKQDQENARVATANEQQKYNKGLIQTNYQNQLSRATGAANMYNQQGQMYADQGANRAANTQGMYSGLAQGVGALGSLYSSNQASNQAQVNKNKEFQMRQAGTWNQ
jgi:hypothetical protein